MATMNTAATTTMTRKDALALAIAALHDNPDAVEVLNKMLASVSREGSKASKPTQRQTDNAELSRLLVESVLTAEPTELDTVISQLNLRATATATIADPITKPRVVNLLTRLFKDGKVLRTEGKGGKSLYSLPVGE